MANTEENLEIWTELLEENGMKINIMKSKVVVIASEEENIIIIMNGEYNEQVTQFKYLGTVTINNGNQ